MRASHVPTPLHSAQSVQKTTIIRYLAYAEHHALSPSPSPSYTTASIVEALATEAGDQGGCKNESWRVLQPVSEPIPRFSERTRSLPERRELNIFTVTILVS